MTDLTDALARLSRPRLLIRAARFGLAEYRRSPAMRRALAQAGALRPDQIVRHLMRREADLDALRRAGDAGYSVARHVDVLIALMAEARHLPCAAQPRAALPPRREAEARSPRRPRPGAAVQPKASGISDLRLETKSSSASRTPVSMAGGW